jgi:hypothetical protein
VWHIGKNEVVPAKKLFVEEAGLRSYCGCRGGGLAAGDAYDSEDGDFQ